MNCSPTAGNAQGAAVVDYFYRQDRPASSDRGRPPSLESEEPPAFRPGALFSKRLSEAYFALAISSRRAAAFSLIVW